jgi:hypothetical protein
MISLFFLSFSGKITDDSYSDDFDFEGSNAKFNKAEVFAKMVTNLDIFV